MQGNEIDLRVRQNYPALLMMLVSLIVALVFENLVGVIRERPVLWDASPETLFFWSQCLVGLAGPLCYWFTLSLSASAVRAVFSPRDTVASILAAVAFNALVAGIGSFAPSVWLLVFAFLFARAWLAFRGYGKVYARDPLVGGDVSTHRGSGRMMVGAGLFVAAAALFLHIEVIGLLGASAGVVTATAFVVAAHAMWFREWQAATGVASASEWVEPAS